MNTNTVAGWEIFAPVLDDEGLWSYVITDNNGRQHYLDESAAAHLLDSCNGHAAPTTLSRLFE